MQKLIYSVQFQPAKAGQSQVRRSSQSKQKILLTYQQGVNNLQQTWINSVKKFGDEPYLDIDDDGKQIRVLGVCSKNRMQWMITDIACILLNSCNVSLYQTLNKQGIQYSMNLTNITTVFCSQSGAKLLSKAQNTKLKNIVSMDPLSQQLIQIFKTKGYNLYYFNQLIQKNKGKNVQLAAIKGQDIYTICFTSGTTGNPKGVLLQHKGFVQIMVALQFIKVVPGDVHLSYLPLPHVFERIVAAYIFKCGGLMVFYRGDTLKIMQDMAIVQPTLWITVPRILTRLYDGINAKFKSLPQQKQKMIYGAVKQKLKNFTQKSQLIHKDYDQMIFKDARALLGGRVRIIVTGSAPVSSQVLDFLKVCWSVQIIQGYGQSQSYGASFVTKPQDTTSGHVGGVTACNQFKLQDVPEMNYYASDKNQHGKPMPRGQICIRGCVFPKYYKSKTQTQQALDKQGWLHTGDVGLILPNGGLKIIDRKKNIFKLQQGQYLAPLKIQNIILGLTGMRQVFIYGDSLQSFCILCCSLETPLIQAIAKNGGLENGPQLLRDKKFKKILIEKIKQFGKKQGLLGFQIPKNVYISQKSFVQLGLMTSTLKLQRFAAKSMFKQQIQKMYKQGEL